jgi:hypothetical protein
MPNRRSFLGTLAAAGVASIGAPSGPLLASAPAVSPAVRRKWDLSWLEAVKAKKHKQVFDLGTMEGTFSPLHFGHFWYEAHKEVSGLPDTQMVVIFGIAGNDFPINFTDAIWAKYNLGEAWKVTDPKTNAPAKRNIFADPAETGMTAAWTVQALQKRGAIFWMCNNALTVVSGMLAGATKQEQPAVYAELKAGLLPGVKLVPSHTMMLGMCQEIGCSYQRV